MKRSQKPHIRPGLTRQSLKKQGKRQENSGMIILTTAKKYCSQCWNCVHSNMARIPEHAVGINIKKTAVEAEMPLTFPIKGQPEPMSIFLID